VIIGVLGDTGACKTGLLTHFAHDFHLLGGVPYANYHLLFPYTHIDALEPLLKQKYDMHGKLFCLDEVWLTADSREHGRPSNKMMSAFILQARKKRGNVIYTEQDYMQVDARIRKNTTYFIEPVVIARRHYMPGDRMIEGKTGLPYIVRANYFNKRMEYLFRNYFVVDKAISLYDTYETQGGLTIVDMPALMTKYRGFQGSKEELFSCLLNEDYKDGSVSKNELKSTATYLFFKLRKQQD